MATVTVFPDAGKAQAALSIIGSGTPPNWGAWGTGAGTADEADTTLFTESPDESRSATTLSRITTNVTNDTVKIVFTVTCATNDKTITNGGAFTAASSGTMWVKSSFDGIALVVGERIEFTFTMPLTQAP